MAEATVRSQASPELTISEDEDSSMNLFLQPRVTASGIMAESKQKVSQKKDSSSKSKSSSKTKTSAKLEDLAVLEGKLSAQIDAKFSSLDEKLGQLLGFLPMAMSDNSQNCDNGTVERGPMVIVDDDTSGVCRPLNSTRNATEGGRRPLISLNSDLNTEFGISNPCLDDDMISLQPGQKERRSLGLVSSEDETASHLEQDNSENLNSVRFSKYSVGTQDKDNNEPLTPDLLAEMFGEDAQTKSAKVEGLFLDKTQIDILENTWHCKFPDKLSAYRETSKQSFPVGKSAEDFLQVPSLDELTERLLVKKHGHKAGFGNSRSLFSQPYKSIEKIAYQGQVAARLGVVSLCYTQQALGLLLSNLKRESPNLDEAVQNVRDIFAMSTKSLDQMARTGAFHHLIRRKATVADTGLHEFKDLQKTALTAPLAAEGVFGPEFEKKLKDRQEKDRQLTDLMPETKKWNKRKNPYFQDNLVQKKSRLSDDRPYRTSSYQASTYRRPTSRGGGFSAKPRSGSKNYSSVSSFRAQGDRTNQS